MHLLHVLYVETTLSSLTKHVMMGIKILMMDAQLNVKFKLNLFASLTQILDTEIAYAIIQVRQK